jgi:Zn-dependent peptidase ImmA (M78 family)
MSAKPLHPGERAARRAREQWGLGLTEPVRDMLEVAEDRQGVPVLIERFNNDGIAGVLLRHGSGDSFVAVNADHNPVRQRFTLAHELGHLYMGHQPRVELSSELFGSTRDPQEVEANYFAAELLAPRAAITGWLEDRDLVAEAAAPDTAAQLALEFGIAFPTAAYRLERVGAIGPTAKQRLVEELFSQAAALVNRHASHRLRDTIQSLAEGGSYPRMPKHTLLYATEARAADLLDEEEYDAIVAEQPVVDSADWVA